MLKLIPNPITYTKSQSIYRFRELKQPMVILKTLLSNTTATIPCRPNRQQIYVFNEKGTVNLFVLLQGLTTSYEQALQWRRETKASSRRTRRKQSNSRRMLYAVAFFTCWPWLVKLAPSLEAQKSCSAVNSSEWSLRSLNTATRAIILLFICYSPLSDHRRCQHIKATFPKST